ncbi:MAG: ROK family glucokinase [Clostridiales bacterium]|nr:ROK family glucokinase [Clostridiales bacterium]
MLPYVFGVDIGGTAIKLGAFRTDGTLLEKWQIPTRVEDGGSHVLPDALDALRGWMARNQVTWSQVEGVGMGVPGPVKLDGTVLRCINLNWGEQSLPAVMKALEPGIAKFRVTNDVNAATLGELWKGAASSCNSAVMVTLGTGIGCGVVADGAIMSGSEGAAGEIGHFCVDRESTVRCKCGKYGCLEQYCSATGLLRCAKLALAQQPERPTALREKKQLTAKQVCDAARAGDALALELLDELGEKLGWALTAVASTVNPEMFLIGGGLSKAGDVLLQPIAASYRKYAFHAFRDTAFALAELGNDAGIYGCAKMVLG